MKKKWIMHYSGKLPYKSKYSTLCGITVDKGHAQGEIVGVTCERCWASWKATFGGKGYARRK